MAEQMPGPSGAIGKKRKTDYIETILVGTKDEEDVAMEEANKILLDAKKLFKDAETITRKVAAEYFKRERWQCCPHTLAKAHNSVSCEEFKFELMKWEKKCKKHSNGPEWEKDYWSISPYNDFKCREDYDTKIFK